MADACVQAGLEIPRLDAATRERVCGLLPSYGSADNPVDTTAQAVDGLTAVIEEVLRSDAIDAMIAVAPLALRSALPFDGDRLRKAVTGSGKPVLVFSYTLPSEPARAFMREVGVPVYDSFLGCARGMRALVDHAAFRANWAASPALQRRPDDHRAAVLARLIPPGNGFLAEHEAKALLRACDITLPPEALGRSVDEAAEMARQIIAEIGADGVVLKVQSREIPHKTDAGGVRLGLRGDGEIRAAFRDLIEAAQRFDAGARIDGVLVQPMLPAGIEVLAGFVHDETLGR